MKQCLKLDKLLTGERTIIAVDEFWKALGDDAFRSFAQDGLKTYRKRNAMMVFATQSPADALKSDIAHSILEQVATQVMLPNPKGSRRDYVEGFSPRTRNTSSSARNCRRSRASSW